MTDTEEVESKAKSRGPQRPTKELILQFVELIEQGVSLDVTCDYLGVAQQTCSQWIKKGRAYNTYPESEPKYEIYGDFEAALKKAAATYNIRMVKRVHNAEKGWSRDLAILERRDRKNYSKYDVMGGQGPLESLDPDQKYA